MNIIYGSAGGLNPGGGQIWTQDSPGVEGVAERNDHFGWGLAVGDFNGDHRDDLAIGVPSEAVGNVQEAGAVNILYGSAGGLTAVGNQIWTQGSSGLIGVAESSDKFGRSLSSGDFNGDGRDDLAIGAPGETVDGVIAAGAVNILYGSSVGLTAVGNQIWSQDSRSIDGVVEADDNFGDALAAGDFDGSGWDDLAIGVAGEDVGGLTNAGAVQILRGSAGGLTATASQLWTQDSPGIEGVAEAADDFGYALAVGDFNQDGRDDLAVASRREDVGNIVSAGAVVISRLSPVSGIPRLCPTSPQ